jgi:hypothetical protein
MQREREIARRNLPPSNSGVEQHPVNLDRKACALPEMFAGETTRSGDPDGTIQLVLAASQGVSPVNIPTLFDRLV